MENDNKKSTNFIPCLKWVRKGVAKANPDNIKLEAEELEQIINETKQELEETEEDEVEDEQEAMDINEDENSEIPSSSDVNTYKSEENEDEEEEDEFQMNKYDEDEKPDALLGIGKIAVYASNSQDPYVKIPDDEDKDSENEDDQITPEDNLLLVGHVEKDINILEVYLYNNEEDSFYVHHDYILPSFPLCFEWVGYDPGSRQSNLVAIGYMSPIIEIWDLDLLNCLEPIITLGIKPSKKKGIKREGHKDAVIDIAWNPDLPHILASGSADESIILWDLDTAKPSTKIKFNGRVQSLEFHPYEGQSLLAGCSDGTASVLDCRTLKPSRKTWLCGGEVEKVLWNKLNPFQFMVGTSEGYILCIDCRKDVPLWKVKCHESEITGLALSSKCPGLLTSCSSDGIFKIWDCLDLKEPFLVSGRNLGLGRLLTLESNPDHPFIFTAGGDKKTKNIELINAISHNDAVKNRFQSRQLLEAVVNNEEQIDN